MKTAVILSTYGEPTHNSFTAQWMYSYRILKGLTRRIAKIPAPVIPIAATTRGIGRVRTWKAENFVSPLEPLTDRTVQALQSEINRQLSPASADSILIARAYEFRKPDLADILPALRDHGCERYILIPMYIGTGDFTDGMTQMKLEQATARHNWLRQYSVEWLQIADDANSRQALADCMVRHIRQCVSQRGLELPARQWAICLAAHGSVQTPPDGVDNGVISFGEVGWRVYKQARDLFGIARLGWLNHTKGGRWTEPAVPRTLELLHKLGYRNCVYFPWGFTTDNAESTLEGGMFAREMQQPFDRFEHLPCLNNTPDFIRLLADRILEHLALAEPTPQAVEPSPARQHAEVAI